MCALATSYLVMHEDGSTASAVTGQLPVRIRSGCKVMTT